MGRVVTSAMAARIIRRGTGLMAGAPTGRPRPGLVTVPTPTPARSSVLATLGDAHSAVAVTRAPSVQSGSSPASLTTTQRLGLSCAASTGNVTRLPLGRRTSTSFGGAPCTRPMTAALAAAEAQVPVVHPVRSPLVTPRWPCGTCGSNPESRGGCGPPVGRRGRLR